MSGLRLAALYSHSPCGLGFCGQKFKKAAQFLEDFLKNKPVNKKTVRRVLKSFEAAYPYYCLIAQSNQINDPFDEKVVEAYWLGNNLLDGVKTADLQRLIVQKFSRPGLLTLQEAKKRSKRVSEGATPHHSFHVLILGSVTGRVKLEGKRRQLCLISVQEEKGQFISYHWGKPCQVLTREQKENLERYTQQNKKVFNGLNR